MVIRCESRGWAQKKLTGGVLHREGARRVFGAGGAGEETRVDLELRSESFLVVLFLACPLVMSCLWTHRKM